MTEACPTSGYECVHRLLARVQAVNDHLIGLVECMRLTEEGFSVEWIAAHLTKLSEATLAAMESYTDDHGGIPVQADVEGVMWLLQRLK